MDHLTTNGARSGRLAESADAGYNHGMDYPVVLEHDADGWTALCPVLPGCISEGETRTEALTNIKDAIRLYLRAVRKEMILLRQKGRTVVRVAA
jgi:predicted RNase H-like HicB family nuclease